MQHLFTRLVRDVPNGWSACRPIGSGLFNRTTRARPLESRRSIGDGKSGARALTRCATAPGKKTRAPQVTSSDSHLVSRPSDRPRPVARDRKPAISGRCASTVRLTPVGEDRTFDAVHCRTCTALAPLPTRRVMATAASVASHPSRIPGLDAWMPRSVTAPERWTCIAEPTSATEK
jgi:hypothetical protein